MADKTAGRSRAETQMTASAARDAAIKEQIAKDSAAFDARTIKLRALRLAREAEEAATKAAHDLANPPKPKKKAVRRVTAG
jgi:hypothetical protein